MHFVHVYHAGSEDDVAGFNFLRRVTTQCQSAICDSIEHRNQTADNRRREGQEICTVSARMCEKYHVEILCISNGITMSMICIEARKYWHNRAYMTFRRLWSLLPYVCFRALVFGSRRSNRWPYTIFLSTYVISVLRLNYCTARSVKSLIVLSLFVFSSLHCL